MNLGYIRRINTEEKAKVVAAAWGKELIQFLAAIAILHQDDLKKRINRITDILGGMDALKKVEDHHVNTITLTYQNGMWVAHLAAVGATRVRYPASCQIFYIK